MIELKNIVVKYGSFTAIKDINIKIKKGEFFTFLGPSGCGKTTTLRTIAGFVNPSEGNIMINGINVTSLKPEERKIGIVFQNYALFPHMSVFENIAFGLKVRRVSKLQIKEKVEKYARIVGVYEQLNKNVTALSGGQQQRVAIARSVIMEPEILLMDEPLSNLDAKLRISMRNELKAIQQKLGITTIYVTHDQEEALILSDRIAVFENGVIEQIAQPEEIYKRPGTENVCKFVGESNCLSSNFISQVFAKEKPNNINTNNKAYIRKEKIHISAIEFPINHQKINISGTIDKVIYSGMYVLYTVSCMGCNLEIVSLDNLDEKFSLNQEVYLMMNTSDILQYGE